jgi:hypothetical protein
VPITVTVVDTWLPITAVVDIDAPGCDVDLSGGAVTCTQTALGLGTTSLPDPYVVFTTSAVFSGTLTNVAVVTATDGITDTNLADNMSEMVIVPIAQGTHHTVYSPLIVGGVPPSTATNGWDGKRVAARSPAPAVPPRKR